MSRADNHIAPEELSAYLDGDLEAARAGEVAAHLEGCNACREVRAQLQAMTAGLKSLGDEAPARDLWRGVERSLAATRPARAGWWRRLWMVPASALAGAAAAVLVLLLVSERPPAGSPQEASGPVQALQAVAEAEVNYRNAVASLQQALRTGEPGWSPETRAVVEQGLADIDRTIERCRAALKNNPLDMEAQETMLAAYQHKVDFLTELVSDTLVD